MEGYTHQPLREKIKQDSYLRKFITDTDISQETLFCTHLLKNFFSHSFASSSQEKQKDYARFIEAVEKNIYADECAQIDFLFASIEFFEEKTIQHREDKDVVTTIPYYLDTTLQCTNDRNPEIAKHISLVKLLCTDIIAYHENAFGHEQTIFPLFMSSLQENLSITNNDISRSCYMVYLEQMKINNIPYMTRDLSIKLYEQIRIFTYLYAQSLSHVEDTIKDHMKESPYPYTKKEIENMKRYIPEYEELFKKNTIPSSHKKTYEQLKKTLGMIHEKITNSNAASQDYHSDSYTINIGKENMHDFTMKMLQIFKKKGVTIALTLINGDKLIGKVIEFTKTHVVLSDNNTVKISDIDITEKLK